MEHNDALLGVAAIGGTVAIAVAGALLGQDGLILGGSLATIVTVVEIIVLRRVTRSPPPP